MPNEPKPARSRRPTKPSPPFTAATAELNTKSSSTEFIPGAYRLELTFSESEAETLASGSVPPSLQDAVIGLLLAIRMTPAERIQYIQDRKR